MKIFVVMGHSGSGKSTFAKEICRQFNLPRIRTNTTRPRRDGEGDDDYQFISISQWVNHEDNFIGVRSYNSFLGKGNSRLMVHYGILEDDLVDNGVIITDLDGFNDLSYRLGNENVVGIYLDLTQEELEERAKLRSDYNPVEFERRYSTDVYSMNAERVDYITTNASGCRIFKLDGSQSVEEWIERFKDIYKEV